MSVIEARGLEKSYRDVHALAGFDLTIIKFVLVRIKLQPRGQVFIQLVFHCARQEPRIRLEVVVFATIKSNRVIRSKIRTVL